MNRSIVVAEIALVTAVCAATFVRVAVNGTEKAQSGISDAQIKARRKLLGQSDEYALIQNDQQMRPRW